MKKIFVILLCAALALSLAGCGNEDAQEEIPELLPAAGVASDVFTVHREDVYVPVMTEASVNAYVEELSFSQSAVVDTVYVHSGESVKQGDLLISVDLSAERARMAEIDSELETMAQQNAIEDEIAACRIQILENEAEYLRQNGGTEQEIALKSLEKEQADLDLKHAQETRALDEEALRSEKEKLAEILSEDGIYAPFDGRVGNILTVQSGQSISAGETLIYLADDTRLSITAEYISDTDWNAADGGAYALIGDKRYEIERVPVDKKEYLSRVLAGKTMYCSFNIVSPEGWENEVHAGDYCALIFNTRYYPDELVVPVNAVLSDALGKYVYIKTEDGQREKRYVKVHTLGSAIYSMVQEGLEEGDVIYVADK